MCLGLRNWCFIDCVLTIIAIFYYFTISPYILMHHTLCVNWLSFDFVSEMSNKSSKSSKQQLYGPHQIDWVCFVNKLNCRHIFTLQLKILFKFHHQNPYRLCVSLIPFCRWAIENETPLFTNRILPNFHTQLKWIFDHLAANRSSMSCWVIYGTLNDISLSFIFIKCVWHTKSKKYYSTSFTDVSCSHKKVLWSSVWSHFHTL